VQTTMETARTKDGCRLAFRVHPNAAKPRLVLIHSLALSGAIWDGVVSELSSEFEILVYDCRGHGESDSSLGRTPWSFLRGSCPRCSIPVAGQPRLLRAARWAAV